MLPTILGSQKEEEKSIIFFYSMSIPQTIGYAAWPFFGNRLNRAQYVFFIIQYPGKHQRALLQAI
jgi:hypothetical protein